MGHVSDTAPAHRAVKGVASSGVVVIDDTYNSNPDGAARALEMLEAATEGGSGEGGGGEAGGRRSRRAVVTPGMVELGPIRDTYLNEKLNLSDDEIARLSPLRQPNVKKPLAIAYGTRELPPLVGDSRALHASRAAEHLPGALIPVAGGDHFTITHELRDADGELTRQLMLLPL